MLATPHLFRSHFPAISPEVAFFENAGGSPVPKQVIEAISRYMLEQMVQLGAPYQKSQVATNIVAEAHQFTQTIFGDDPQNPSGFAILGSSSTQLITMLSECYGRFLKPGATVIVAETGHEANIGPWMNLKRLGINVEVWPVNPETEGCEEAWLRERLAQGDVALVAFVHVSNLLGEVVDIKNICSICKQYGARTIVDGVAYAPHAALKVLEWGCDWYVFSCYKVYGPHLAALWGMAAAVEELTGPNHFFVPKEDAPYKFQLGGVSHELAAGWLGLEEYLKQVSPKFQSAFDQFRAHELTLQKALIEPLLGDDEIRIVGPQSYGEERVPTVSILHRHRSSSQLANELCDRGILCRNGHMYAYRLCEKLGIDLNEGVLRLSLNHLNTVEEVERFHQTWREVTA